MILNLPLFLASTSGLAALGVSWSALVIQLITFVLGFLLIKKYAVKPIMKILDDRRQKIEQGLELSEVMIKQEKELKIKVDNLLHQARQEADQMIADASSEAQSLVKKAENDANKRGELLIEEAKERIKLETSRAKKELESEILSLIGQTTGALLRQKLNQEEDNRFIKRLLQEEEKTVQ